MLEGLGGFNMESRLREESEKRGRTHNKAVKERGVRGVAERGTVLTRIRERCARTSELPLLVRSGVFFFFICLGRKVFWSVFHPFSRGGNFGLHSTPLSYAS